MRLVSFRIKGRPTFGRLEGDAVHDLGHAAPSLAEAIASGGYRESGRTTYALADIELLPPLPAPAKIICIGKNYRAHVAEAGHAAPPKHPSLFLRLSNTLVAHGGALVRPKVSAQFDYEGELALVIGRPGRHIPPERALDHIFGYSVFNDGSVRDYQFGHSLAVGKNFHATGGFGPAIVTADEVPDPAKLRLRTWLNGSLVQDGNTSDLIYDIPTIIAYASTFTPLLPGDVIATGTPEGVGFARKPPLWMKAGDRIEIEIDGVGRLVNSVIDEV